MRVQWSDGTSKSRIHARAHTQKLPHSLKFMEKRPRPSGTQYGRPGSDYSTQDHKHTHTHTKRHFQASIISLTHPRTGATRELSFVDLLEKPSVTHARQSAPSISSQKKNVRTTERQSVQERDSPGGGGGVHLRQ